MMKFAKLLLLPLTLISLLSFSACDKNVSSSAPLTSSQVASSSPVSMTGEAEERRLQYGIPEYFVSEGFWYKSKEEVAAYLAVFHRMPDNYVSQASKPGQCTTRGVFTNVQEILPVNYTYIEMDIDAEYGQMRGKKRIVFSNTFRIFYTEDHYKSFVEYLGYQNWTPDYDIYGS